MSPFFPALGLQHCDPGFSNRILAPAFSAMPDLHMSPGTGARLVRHAGDHLRVTLRPIPPGWQARLRTNLGRADRVREEIVRSHFEKLPLAGSSWRDLPMQVEGDTASILLPLTEVGHFKAKAFAIDVHGQQHWPGGVDIGIGVHPSWTRTANLIYCAFPRMFGEWSRNRERTGPDHLPSEVQALDKAGWTIIPPGGTLRSVLRELPHIFDTLGSRILHLLPVSPVPTTFARFGRFGSPYALQDLTAIDPALVEFDQRTTGIDQFIELARGVHARGGRLMLDLVINHTGWGSREWNEHPEWFLRHPDGRFHSPGAWDVVWEDLVEFDQSHIPLWDYLARVFLTWCRRGVDAFRCDAGYKIPLHVWQFITARVRQEFPDTVFLLEGLGGSWEATNALLAEGGMQWAYSELFQNFGPHAVGSYIDYALRTSLEAGTLVHYSETHDNTRLAARGASPHAPLTPEGRRWSLHRNRLSALTSVQGAFGFTNGVEWCATEQVNVHSSRGLNWGSRLHLIPELHRLHQLLAHHPCFFDGARLSRLDLPGSPVLALRRDSADGLDICLVLVNTQFDQPGHLLLSQAIWEDLGSPRFDLALADPSTPSDPVGIRPVPNGVELILQPGAAHCLAVSAAPRGLAGDAYRHARARADWALAALNRVSPVPVAQPQPWTDLAAAVDADPFAFLAQTLPHAGTYPRVIRWIRADIRRIVPVPPDHWLLVELDVPFKARLISDANPAWEVAESVPAADAHFAAFPPTNQQGPRQLHIEIPSAAADLEASLFLTGRDPALTLQLSPPTFHGPLTLLTNGRGSMARIPVDIGRTTSKYDCLLGANLHPRVPVDRHIFLKRFRTWIEADGFISPLTTANLLSFEPGPPAHWRFVVNAGDGRAVEIHLVADLIPDQNTVVLRFSRMNGNLPFGTALPADARVRLTVRLDLEDRNFHWETRRNEGADHHFHVHTRSLAHHQGFSFAPGPDRALRAWVDAGSYRPSPEWSEHLPHPVEGTRGMQDHGDAWSPGWFDIPLEPGGSASVIATAEIHDSDPGAIADFVATRAQTIEQLLHQARIPAQDHFGSRLAIALSAYVVRRDNTRTVIAGYPWFLDWGRDSLIAARGMLAAGCIREVRDLILTFARFEKDGTLPNSIHGEDASNRDTTDAPLWFGIVCEELAPLLSPDQTPLHQTVVDDQGRTVADVLRSIASGYLAGTPNGIRVDHASGLVWSPPHFTWMDTNHPAATPREGYPVEIQALWIRLLRQLASLRAAPWDGRGESWADLAQRALKSFNTYFWLEDCGWLADCLVAAQGVPARTAAPCNALRSNTLLPVTLDLVSGSHAQRIVENARRHLVVPGALRSLAPLPVTPPLPVHGHHGQLLNDPDHPYWGHYRGDEDTSRKPAYHNGTAWTWTFPAFCEALVKAHPGDPAARIAARAYLGSMAVHLQQGCIGHLPEIIEGDAPHAHRGCDAQAWSTTEALRVWRWLDPASHSTPSHT